MSKWIPTPGYFETGTVSGGRIIAVNPDETTAMTENGEVRGLEEGIYPQPQPVWIPAPPGWWAGRGVCFENGTTQVVWEQVVAFDPNTPDETGGYATVNQILERDQYMSHVEQAHVNEYSNRLRYSVMLRIPPNQEPTREDTTNLLRMAGIEDDSNVTHGLSLNYAAYTPDPVPAES